MKLVLTIKEKDIIIEMNEAKKIYEDLKQIFEKKVEHPYTGIRDTNTRSYKSAPFIIYKELHETTGVTHTPTIS